MLSKLSIGLLSFALTLFAAFSASAVNYGNFMDLSGTVSYNNVRDNAGLFGLPQVSVNSLDFSPSGFNATCIACGATQTTDILQLDILATSGQQITEIGINEGLDYQVIASAVGGSATVLVTANVFVDVFEVDGSGINGVNGNFSVVFDPSNSAGVSSPGAVGSNSDFGIITGALNIDVQSILSAFSITGDATGVSVSFDNTLTAIHSGGGLAQIRKRDLDFVSLTVNGGNPVPEPGTAVLLLGGLAALAARRESQR